MPEAAQSEDHFPLPGLSAHAGGEDHFPLPAETQEEFRLPGIPDGVLFTVSEGEQALIDNHIEVLQTERRIWSPLDVMREDLRTPGSAWRARTLSDLARTSRRGKKLNTPSYRKRGFGPVWNWCFKFRDDTGRLLPSRQMDRGDTPPPKFTIPWSAPDRNREKPEEKKRRSNKLQKECEEEAKSEKRRDSTTTRGVDKIDDELKRYLPDMDAVLARLRSGEEGFDSQELEKIDSAYVRYKVPDAPEIHKSELPRVVQFLGYSVCEEAVTRLAGEITGLNVLEKEEFVSFMEKYAKFEYARYRQLFDEADGDGNGDMDKEEVTKFLCSLGFTPLRRAVTEAIALVDDGNKTLDFEELVLLLHVFKCTEGFCMDEVIDLAKAYQAMEVDDKGVHPSEVQALLMDFFGPQVARYAAELQKNIPLGSRADAIDSEDETWRKKEVQGMTFKEALCWARRLREQLFEHFREEYHKADSDNSGHIDEQELRHLLERLGYTLCEKALSEFLEMAKEMGEMPPEMHAEGMDFDTFVNFMSILQRSDGFTISELEEINAAFDKFDDDNSGDIDVVELQDLLRHMGYMPKLEEVRSTHALFDLDDSGTISKPEFVHFMRLHHEREMAAMKAVFENYQDNGFIPAADVEFALAAAAAGVGADEAAREHSTSTRLQKVDLLGSIALAPLVISPKEFAVGRDLDYDSFLEQCEVYKEAHVQLQRRRCGFTDADIEKYLTIFDQSDTERTGYLNGEGFNSILKKIGYQMKTVEDQKEIVAQLAKARETAAEHGVKDAQKQGIGFWVFLRMVRLTMRKDDVDIQKKLRQVGKEAKFSTEEITEFQEVFDNCWDANLIFEDPEDRDGQKNLSMSALFRLLRNMGIKIDSKQRLELTSQINLISGGRQAVDFVGFLKLMRWMMDNNFCDINGSSARRS